MYVCYLCGLAIENIPDDAIQVGKLYRFTNGEFHYLRKRAPRTAAPKHRRNRDREAPEVKEKS